MSRFATRSYEKELMDDLECDGPELRQTLRELKTVNQLLGGNYVTTNGIKQLLKGTGQKSVTIADIGCGGGDMIRVMADWAKKNKLNCHFVGIDANPNIIQMASENLRDLENVTFQTTNVFDLDFQERPVDLITCTLFTHHFTDEELVIMLKAFRQKTRIGMIINDLHRHPIAYYSIKLLTRIFSRSNMVKHDGHLSVQRSFRKKEIYNILEKSGWNDCNISWNWAFRWQILCRKE
jgi:2-polyprenyl-3-methyl-5-hydroxy-6-metoxy-1,4-benzoquinol methylase